MLFLDLNVLFYRLVNIYSFLLDFIKFFFKKDFFFICLISFNDRFEIYVFWKNSFKNIMEELGVILVEEIDLFVKWFGKDL